MNYIIEHWSYWIAMAVVINSTLLALKFHKKYRTLKQKYNVLFCEHPGCGFLKYYQFRHCTLHHIPTLEGIDRSKRDRVHPEPLPDENE